MFRGKESEPPLHQAVLAEDYPAIIRLSHDPSNLAAVNALQFNALELACLLGKTRAIHLLQSYSRPYAGQLVSRREIKVQFPGGNPALTLTCEAFEKLMGVEYTPYLRFTNYEHLKATIANCPWVLGHTFVGREHRAQGLRYSTKLWEGFVADTLIKWIDPVMGYGLFTEKEFAEGEYIGEYAGVVRRLFRPREGDQQDLVRDAYCVHYPTKWWSREYSAIDAWGVGNELRFVNHSDTPNLRLEWLYDRGLLHLAFFASRAIARGEQLFFDYGTDYWRHRQKSG